MKSFKMSSLAMTTTAVALSFSFLAYAAGSLTELNNRVAQLIAPMQSVTTKINLEFKDIAVDAVRAKSLEAAFSIWKQGPSTDATLALDQVSYQYGDGTAPKTTIKGFIKTDFLKLVSQKDINSLGKSADGFVKDFASEMGSQYGDALTVKANVFDKQLDSSGNFQAFKISVSGTFDFSKLPPSKDKKDIFFQSASAQFSFNLKSADFKIALVSNPTYRGFASDEAGLKDYLNMLLAGDSEMTNQVNTGLAFLNQYAEAFVNMKPSN